MDRWDIEIKDLYSNETNSLLVATPKETIMVKFVNEAVTALQNKIANKEEELIFRGSTRETLERIRDCCLKILAERDQLRAEQETKSE